MHFSFSNQSLCVGSGRVSLRFLTNVRVAVAKPATVFFLRAGAGFASQDLFLHGFFSAAIKLPADYAAGVVVAFYVRAAAAAETLPSTPPAIQC